MLVADEFLGTLADETVASRVDQAESLTITVDEVERRRSRFRTTAENGQEVGVVVARELQDEDVLDADGTPVVVSLATVEAMVLDYSDVTEPDTAILTSAIELGHAVGNRHWDLVVRDEAVYLPLSDDRERMQATIDDHLPEAASVRYESVQPTLFDGSHGHEHTHVPDLRPEGDRS